jgi:hypothetical protein
MKSNNICVAGCSFLSLPAYCPGHAGRRLPHHLPRIVERFSCSMLLQLKPSVMWVRDWGLQDGGRVSQRVLIILYRLLAASPPYFRRRTLRYTFHLSMNTKRVVLFCESSPSDMKSSNSFGRNTGGAFSRHQSKHSYENTNGLRHSACSLSVGLGAQLWFRFVVCVSIVLEDTWDSDVLSSFLECLQTNTWKTSQLDVPALR